MPAPSMVLKWDVSGNDPSESVGKEFVQPKPGVYQAEIVKCVLAKPEGKDQRIEVTYKITDPKAEGGNGAHLTDYINTESEIANWRVDQFLLAVGEASTDKRKGQTNLGKLQGHKVKVRVKGDSYTPPASVENPEPESQYRAKVGAVLAPGATSDEHTEDPHAGTGDESTSEVDETWNGFLGMEEGDLEANIDAIEEYAAQYGVDTNAYATWAEAVEAINDVMTAGGEDTSGGDGDAAPEGTQEDYNSWSIEDLNTELKERGLPATGPKSAKVKRLEEADKTSPFGD